MSEMLGNEFSSVYFTGNLNSASPHQAFCGNLESIVINYESVCKGLSTLDVEATIEHDGFPPLLQSSCQAAAFPFYLIFK